MIERSRDLVADLGSARSTEHRHTHSAPRSPRRFVWLGIGVVGIAALLGIRALLAGSAFSLPNEVQDLLTLSISVIIESLPFVILGILLSIVVQVWLPDGILMKYLKRMIWKHSSNTLI